MNIEVLSKETIKASSPTPKHLRNLKLSFLDQLASRTYVPTIFFYDHAADTNSHGNDDHLERSNQLKKSLGECLSRYYPLAGTIREDFSVDCNNEGAKYIEARVRCKLSESIGKPNVELFNQLLPFDPYGNVIGCREALVGVQFNIFDCGGVAIGVCVSHKIADAASVATFVNAWATISRGFCSSEADDEEQHPIFNAAMLFPPRDMPGLKRETETRNEKIVTKMFVFDKLNIVALKECASSSCVGVLKYSPTSVQTCVAVHVVNLRDKMVPPLPNHVFGNLWQTVMAPTMVDGDKDLGALASLIGSAVREINDDHVRRVKVDDGNSMRSSKNMRELYLKGEIEALGFSSWCGFPFYEVDFGWGKPTWVCTPNSPYKNFTILMNTKQGDGIEAWVNLLEEDMAIFERDLDLLSFVSSVH
ncbi:stemmadenine O-acetyltransferase-like [Cornus florida]|uniref:stemmadenine O-acetyltransferase-like n=1 Tax=Cornus florida TaxID=4283 RepID=UPI00289F1ACA|nr:stemmadenine O-acetyltransferase-like [Cornus florida]